MAPKAQKAVDKSAQKAREKIAEDKTFGLKNKNKSKVVQKFVQQVNSAAKNPPTKAASQHMEKQQEEKANKKALMQQQLLLNALFKGTENIKTIDANAPKKAHDNATTKAEQKLNFFVDVRDQKENKVVVNDWTDDQVREYAEQKLATAETSIVCNFFLDAVRDGSIGWFWKCTNGDSCKYLHMLLPGMSISSKKETTADGDDEDEMPIDEKIEYERSLLTGGTLLTKEVFEAWKQKKEEERLKAVQEALLESQSKNKKAAIAQQNAQNGLSGKDLFTFNPNLFVDDDDAANANAYEEDETYWSALQNENQKILDQANADALAHFEDEDVDLDDLEDD